MVRQTHPSAGSFPRQPPQPAPKQADARSFIQVSHMDGRKLNNWATFHGFSKAINRELDGLHRQLTENHNMTQHSLGCCHHRQHLYLLCHNTNVLLLGCYDYIRLPQLGWLLEIYQ